MDDGSSLLQLQTQLPKVPKFLPPGMEKITPEQYQHLLNEEWVKDALRRFGITDPVPIWWLIYGEMHLEDYLTTSWSSSRARAKARQAKLQKDWDDRFTTSEFSWEQKRKNSTKADQTQPLQLAATLKNVPNMSNLLSELAAKAKAQASPAPPVSAPPQQLAGQAQPWPQQPMQMYAQQGLPPWQQQQMQPQMQQQMQLQMQQQQWQQWQQQQQMMQWQQLQMQQQMRPQMPPQAMQPQFSPQQWQGQLPLQQMQQGQPPAQQMQPQQQMQLPQQMMSQQGAAQQQAVPPSQPQAPLLQRSSAPKL